MQQAQHNTQAAALAQNTKHWRFAFKSSICDEGGAYIVPEDNHQPDEIPPLASIEFRGVMGIGTTEAQAQADWFANADPALHL